MNESLLQHIPSISEIDSACLSFRHDFGLMPKEEQDQLRYQARIWLTAWGFTLPQFKTTPEAPQTPPEAFHGCPLIHQLDTVNGTALEIAETLPQMIRAAAHECSKGNIRLEVYQQDWIAGFAAFCDDGSLKKHPDAKAHVVLNVGSFMAAVESKDIEKKDLPYAIAESLMHEFIHAIEAWAEIEFDEARIEALLTAYREKYAQNV